MGFQTAFENFIFRYFNFWDRAKRSEYWWIMPILWTAIIVLFWLDLSEIWGKLRAGEKPSLDPFHHESVLIWVLTLIPRYAVTVRRLNDTGRSPKWALLPIKATIFAVISTFGVLSTIATSGLGSDALQDTAVVAALSVGMFSFADGDLLWSALFAFAQIFEPHMIWDALKGTQMPELQGVGGNISAVYGNDPGTAATMMLIAAALVLGPPLMMMLFILFMLAPSKVNYFDPRMLRSEKAIAAAMSGYAALEKINRATTAETRAAQQVQIKELYRARVLRQSPPGA